jgi:hypothetical protein
MSARSYEIDLRTCHKLIVGEGVSDRNFFAALCARNGIEGFGFAFTAMHDPQHRDGGFGAFYKYLSGLTLLRGFADLTDLVLVADTTDKLTKRANELRGQVQRANAILKCDQYECPTAANIVSTNGTPRVHILMIPKGSAGGLESVCFGAARDHHDPGGEIEGWVNTFADSACSGWTTEKRDKLRLQAFLSAAWKKKPEMTFSQLFDITQDKLVPLTSDAFADIRELLKQIAAL